MNTLGLSKPLQALGVAAQATAIANKAIVNIWPRSIYCLSAGCHRYICGAPDVEGCCMPNCFLSFCCGKRCDYSTVKLPAARPTACCYGRCQHIDLQRVKAEVSWQPARQQHCYMSQAFTASVTASHARARILKTGCFA